jgi:hypothetical protein
MCYTTRGDHVTAIDAARAGFEIAKRSPDATITAMSRFFYGRSLLLAEERDEAVKQFNERGLASLAIALCVEPSPEHRNDLKELIKAGGDVDTTDEYGYIPLDYAVLDAIAENVVM